MSYSIHRHLTFNTWANTQLVNTLKETADEIYFHENKSSFPSIAKTVAHMFGAQNIWLKRLQGNTQNTWPSSEFEKDKSGALNGLVQTSSELQLFIGSKGDDFLGSEYSYTNMKGEPFRDPVEDTLFHIVNHSTYHRGQIISMLREAGVTNIVSTDLIHYLRNNK